MHTVSSIPPIAVPHTLRTQFSCGSVSFYDTPGHSASLSPPFAFPLTAYGKKQELSCVQGVSAL